MNICQAPSTMATPKTAKASQKCARIRRRLFNTAQPRPRVGHLEEFGPVDHLDLGPHPLMPHPAEFLTRHRMLAGSVEARMDGCDIAGHQHRVYVRALDQETVDHIG